MDDLIVAYSSVLKLDWLQMCDIPRIYSKYLYSGGRNISHLMTVWFTLGPEESALVLI